jgi:uncharacterized protein (PEP-CTERM system associated)
MAIILTTIKPPSWQGGHKLSSILAPAFALAAVMIPRYASAAEWRVTPSLAVRETYTDNVRLTSSEKARSDFITDISPGISVTGTSPRLKLRASYAPHYIKYLNDPQGSTLAQRFEGSTNAELVEQLFYFDGTASVGQQNISPLGPQPVDNTNVAGNRTTVRTYSASPYLRHSFGSTAAGEVRYARSATSSGESSLGYGHNDMFRLNLDSGPAFRTLGWDVRHTKQKYANSSIPSTDSTSTMGSLRYMVTPQFHLIATGGHEKYQYDSIGPATSGASYSGGFSWRPTERTRIAASVGKRFFGRTYSLDSNVRSRSTVWQLTYNEDITTTQAQAAAQAQTNTSTSDFLNQLFMSSIPDPAARQQAVDRFILSTGLPANLSRSTNFLSNQFFLQKTARASVALTGARNTLVFAVFNTNREAQTAYDAALSGFGSTALGSNTRQRGVDVVWNWRLTPFTSANFNTAYSRTQLTSTDAASTTKLARMTIATRLRPNLDGAVELRRQMQDSEVAAGSYVENAVSAFVSMRF